MSSKWQSRRRLAPPAPAGASRPPSRDKCHFVNSLLYYQKPPSVSSSSSRKILWRFGRASSWNIFDTGCSQTAILLYPPLPPPGDPTGTERAHQQSGKSRRRLPQPGKRAGESWPPATIPMENSYCSCRHTGSAIHQAVRFLRRQLCPALEQAEQVERRHAQRRPAAARGHGRTTSGPQRTATCCCLSLANQVHGQRQRATAV